MSDVKPGSNRRHRSFLQVLLSRYAREDDVLVGTEHAGRGAPELAGVVGCLANPLALRTDLSGPRAVGPLCMQAS